MGLLELSCDVWSIIWLHLSLKDINRLRQTCAAIATEISGNKQLWVHLFKREVKARSLRIPSNLRALQDIETMDARDIELWVKHATLLDRAYKTPNTTLNVRRVDIPRNLRVTWLKLVLGRWCLVAAANDDESELSLWEITPDGMVRFAAKVYVDAPVMDGKVDCSTGAVRCAITVGSTHPYILVLEMHHSGNNVAFRELAQIPNASHVQFFRGDLVGFAVRNGDDTYPYLANWVTGDAICLRFPNNTTPPRSSPFPIEACKAMTMRGRFIFTLHHTSAQVFLDQGATGNFYADHVASLPLEIPVIDGEFLDGISTGSDREGGGMVIRIAYQDNLSRLHQASITLDPEFLHPGSCHLQEFSIKQPPNLPTVRTLHVFHVGSSGRTFFCVTSLSRRIWWTPTLLFVSLCPTTTAEDPLQVDGNYIPISRSGFPLVRLLSAVDFDDENGLLLLGTTIGDVRLASVLPQPIITRKSVRADLNMAEHCGNGPDRTSKVPVSLDLPLFYSLRKDYIIYDPLPQDITTRIVSEWVDSRLGVLPFSDWTNDWTKSKYLWDWILPLSRWGPLDDDFSGITISTILHSRLQALGEIIPVLYCADNHCEVIFRIGNSMFYCMMMREDEPDVGIFEEHEDGFLGVLPLSYDHFLSDPMSIFPSLWDYATRTNLDSRTCPVGYSRRADVAGTYITARAYLDKFGEGHINATEMETWSNDDWDKYTCDLKTRTRPYKEPPEKG